MSTTPNGHRPGAAAPESCSGDTKQFANLQARGALAGITIHQLATGSFLCCRWGLSREVDTLARVEQWLDLTTGSRA